MTHFRFWAACLLLTPACVAAAAQTDVQTDALPDSPGTMQQAPHTPEGTASVSGVVLDVQGSAVPGAKVVLDARGKFDQRSTDAAADGSFSFTGLPAEQYRVTVSSPGFQQFISDEIIVKAGAATTVPKIALQVSSTTSSIDVTAGPDQIAVAQVQEEEKQRIFGVLPNFYTSYIWKAEPMPAKLKYKLAFRSLIDPFTFLIVAGVAGAEHYNGTYPDYGPGIAGYGKRYAAAYGDALSARLIGSAILPAVLHQDPRYFYQGTGGVVSRSEHAVASTFIARGDNGKRQIAFSHLLGSLAAGAIANAYHPPASRGIGLTFETFGITTGSNMIGNLFREFVFRSLEPSVPIFANGKAVK